MKSFEKLKITPNLLIKLADIDGGIGEIYKAGANIIRNRRGNK